MRVHNKKMEPSAKPTRDKLDPFNRGRVSTYTSNPTAYPRIDFGGLVVIILELLLTFAHSQTPKPVQSIRVSGPLDFHSAKIKLLPKWPQLVGNPELECVAFQNEPELLFAIAPLRPVPDRPAANKEAQLYGHLHSVLYSLHDHEWWSLKG